MAMRIKQYSAERIAQYSSSRATLGATGRRHRRTPWSSISAFKIELSAALLFGLDYR
jgi:hypothetical protein